MVLYSKVSTASYDRTFVILYIIEGFIIVSGNSILTFRLFMSSKLRAQKEYVILGSCLLFDIFFGLTYFSAGIWRASVVLSYDYFPLVSMWTCFLTVHNQLFIIVTAQAGILLLTTAIDRFICVFYPISYIKLQVNYAYTLMSIPYILIIPFWIPAALGAYSNEGQNFTMNCLLNQSIQQREYILFRSIRICTTLLCVFIYIPIFYKMWMSIHSSSLSYGSSRTSVRLLNMTKTVALITGSTLILFTVPDVITYVSPFINSNLMYLMNLNKGTVNLLIFLITQKTVRGLMFPPKLVKASDINQQKTTRTNVTTFVI